MFHKYSIEYLSLGSLMLDLLSPLSLFIKERYIKTKLKTAKLTLF